MLHISRYELSGENNRTTDALQLRSNGNAVIEEVAVMVPGRFGGVVAGAEGLKHLFPIGIGLGIGVGIDMRIIRIAIGRGIGIESDLDQTNEESQ